MYKVVRVSSECRSSHPGICRRVNSLLFTFVTKANVSDLGKVMEPTGIPGQLPRCGDAPVGAGSIHSTGHRTWTGPGCLECIRLFNGKAQTRAISEAASGEAERTQSSPIWE